MLKVFSRQNDSIVLWFSRKLIRKAVWLHLTQPESISFHILPLLLSQAFKLNAAKEILHLQEQVTQPALQAAQVSHWQPGSALVLPALFLQVRNLLLSLESNWKTWDMLEFMRQGEGAQPRLSHSSSTIWMMTAKKQPKDQSCNPPQCGHWELHGAALSVHPGQRRWHCSAWGWWLLHTSLPCWQLPRAAGSASSCLEHWHLLSA